jgi:hypothetical protein
VWHVWRHDRTRQSASSGIQQDPRTILEADEPIASRQQRKALSIGVVAGERLSILSNQQRQTRVRDARQPAGRVELEPALEKYPLVPDSHEPVGSSRHDEVRQFVKPICVA